MRSYECTVIFTPGASEEALKTGTDKFARLIAGGGGEISLLETWGKRRLAYEINDFTEGHYFLYKFRGERTLLDELGRQLRIDESVIRHMICRDELATGREPKVEPDNLAAVERVLKEEVYHRGQGNKEEKGQASRS